MSRLHRAARFGDIERVATCLAEGDDINEMGVHATSPLLVAARKGHLEVVRLLLEAGAQVDLVNRRHETALRFAAMGGHVDVVRELVSHGADVNAVLGKSTAALDAARFDQRDVVAFLESVGADVHFKGPDGISASEWLERGGIGGQFDPAMLETPERIARETAMVRKQMAQGLSAEEYAAVHGRRILVWSYGIREYVDREAQEWARQVSEILRTPGLLEKVEEQYLQGEDLEDARRCRGRSERRERVSEERATRRIRRRGQMTEDSPGD